MDGSPGELAVTDLTAAGRAKPTSLAHGERREIVVEEKGLLIRALQGVDELLVFAGAKRGHHQSLSFATREQGRTMGARQHADLAADRPDGLHVAPVDARAVVENVPANDFCLELLKHARDLWRRIFRLRDVGRTEMTYHSFFCGIDRLVPRHLLGNGVSGA